MEVSYHFGPKYFSVLENKKIKKISFYLKYTNEMLGELSHKNMISSHVKITCYLHMCTKIPVAKAKK